MIKFLEKNRGYRPRRDNTVICIFGKKGSGKSALTAEIINEFNRVIVIDSNGEYDRYNRFVSKNIEVISGYKESLERLRQASSESHFRISLRSTSEAQDIRLIDIAGTIPNILLVVEETSRYVSATVIPRPIAWLIRFGRHSDISQIYIARRPSEISRELTANADIIVSFRQQEPRDLAYLRAMTGEPVTRVRNLKKYQPYIYTDSPEKLPYAIQKRM